MDSRDKPCTTCAEPIRAVAKKCIHCDSFQDWRRHMPVSATVLSSMLALVSVLTVFVSVALDRLPKSDAFVDFTVSHVSETGRLYLLVSNSGEKPGFLSRGRLSVPLADGRALDIRYDVLGADAQDRFLMPGDFKVMTLDPARTVVLDPGPRPQPRDWVFEGTYDTFDGIQGTLSVAQSIARTSDYFPYLSKTAATMGVSLYWP